jgi:hypothetical protein
VQYARDQQFKLYDDGKLYDVPADELEQRPIAPGSGSAAAEAARRKLQAVLNQQKTRKG